MSASNASWIVTAESEVWRVGWGVGAIKANRSGNVARGSILFCLVFGISIQNVLDVHFCTAYTQMYGDSDRGNVKRTMIEFN